MGGADLDLVAFALPQDAGHGLMEGASEHLAPGRKNLRNCRGIFKSGMLERAKVEFAWSEQEWNVG